MKSAVYIQYTNPAAYPPLEHGSRILAAAGWRVLFLGVPSSGSAEIHFEPHPSIRSETLTFRGGRPSRKTDYARFCFWAVVRAAASRPSWIYASDPFSCLPALALSFLGFPVIYHEHDSPGRVSSGFMRLVLRARRALARRAAISVLPNASRARAFEGDTGGKAICVWNCPPRFEAAAAPAKAAGDLWLYYQGTLTPPRLPLALLDAMAAMPPYVKLRIAGYETIGYTGYLGEFCRKADALGLAARVEFTGVARTRQELCARCGSAHVGVSFMPKSTEDPNEKDMVGASNKPFEYLAAGLALLVSDIPEWKKTYVEPGYGLACDPADPASIAAALKWFAENREAAARMGEAGRRKVEGEWNYEKQFRPVFERMERGEAR